ncbi:hypothetical protein ACQ4M3_20490 [Leptolyngbya sp. AN03gr2]|uniref:hypothetical protein n=1 Tax=unclassified Leptolyngbya TaxID=2650499 RepID=UPI003D31032B
MQRHNFFWDNDRRNRLFDEFTHVIFAAIARTTSFEVTGTSRLGMGEEQLKALYPNVEAYEYMEHQGRLFDQMRSRLMETYANLFVHFEDGKVLDSALERRSLLERIPMANYPHGVFIEQLLNDNHNRRDDSQKPCFEKTNTLCSVAPAKPYS